MHISCDVLIFQCIFWLRCHIFHRCFLDLFHGEFSDELQFHHFQPSRHDTPIVRNHSRSLRILLLRWKFHPSRLFLWTTVSRNSLCSSGFCSRPLSCRWLQQSLAMCVNTIPSKALHNMNVRTLHLEDRRRLQHFLHQLVSHNRPGSGKQLVNRTS